MAIAHVASVLSNDEQSSAGNDSSYVLPGTAQAGHFAIAIVTANSNAETITSAPSGWSLVAVGSITNPQSNGTTIEAWAYAKILTSGDISAGTLTWSTSGTRRAAGVMEIFSGVDATTPIEAAASDNSAAGASLAAPAVTSLSALAWIVNFWTGRTTGTTAPTITVPGTHTPLGYSNTAFSSGADNATRGGRLTTPGAVGSYGPYSASVSPNASGVMFSFALKPAASGQTVAVGQVTETDTPNAFTRLKAKLLGLVTGTSTAQAMGRLKARAVAQVSELDEAQAFSRGPRSVAFGQISETDAPQVVTAVKSRTIGQASEVDSLPVVPYDDEVLADAPEGYWRLGEAAGSTSLADASGNGHTAAQPSTSTQRATLGVTGLLVDDADTAASFDGGDHLEVPSSSAWNSSAITVEAVIQTTSTGIVTILARDPGTSAQRVFQFRVNAGKLELIILDSNAVADTKTGTVNVNDGAAHHVVAVYTGSILRLYVDGEQDGTDTTVTRTLTQASSNGGMYVGARNNSTGGSANYTGTIDEVAYYKSALSSARIAAHAAAAASQGSIRPVLTAGSHTIAVGQVSTTNTAQAMGRSKVKAIGQLSETDTANATGKLKLKAIGQALEVDEAQTVGHGVIVPVGQPSELDAAQAVGKAKLRVVGQVSETDAAQPIGQPGATIVPVGQASETDTSQAMGRRKRVTFAQVTSTMQAQALSRLKARGLAQALETELAQAIHRPRLVAVGQALEVDEAQPVTVTSSPAGTANLTFPRSDGTTSPRASGTTDPASSGTTYPRNWS